MSNVEIPNKVDELRTALINAGVDEGRVASMGRAELKALYHNEIVKPSATPFGIVYESVTGDANVVESAEAATKQELLPQYGSPEWQSYVLSQLRPNEQLDGFPRCFGLRRVAQELLGPIVSAKASSVSVIPQSTVNDTPTRAVTINYEITFDWTLDRSVWVDPRNPVINYRTFGGVSDCVEEVNSPWGKHPASSAETKAMSRALKQALCINVLSAEEKVSGYEEGPTEGPKTSKITDQLISFITAKANQLQIKVEDVMKAKNMTGPIKELTLEDGRDLFAAINKYQQNP
jgi:hypothetical protein